MCENQAQPIQSTELGQYLQLAAHLLGQPTDPESPLYQKKKEDDSWDWRLDNEKCPQCQTRLHYDDEGYFCFNCRLLFNHCDKCYHWMIFQGSFCPMDGEDETTFQQHVCEHHQIHNLVCVDFDKLDLDLAQCLLAERCCLFNFNDASLLDRFGSSSTSLQHLLTVHLVSRMLSNVVLSFLIADFPFAILNRLHNDFFTVYFWYCLKCHCTTLSRRR